jgi:hypothetical protein
MEIIVVSTTIKEEKINIDDIKYPYYRYQDCSDDNYSSIYFSKITKDKIVTINSTEYYDWAYADNKGPKYTLEVEENKQTQRVSKENGLNYILGKGKYSCTEAQFNDIFQEIKDLVSI